MTLHFNGCVYKYNFQHSVYELQNESKLPLRG